MIATLTGRIQTKLLTLTILCGVGAVFAAVYGPYLWSVVLVAAMAGLVLEAAWSLFIVYQPGWLTWLMAAIEYGLIVMISLWLQLPVSLLIATLLYITAWVLVQLFLLYVLPVINPRWPERSLELWS